MMILLAAIGRGKSIWSGREKQHKEIKLQTRNTPRDIFMQVDYAAYLDFILSWFQATTASQQPHAAPSSENNQHHEHLSDVSLDIEQIDQHKM